MRVLVVGAGLIGTSLGLALRRSGHEVLLSDPSTENLDLAVDRGAGQVHEPQSGASGLCDLWVAAAPLHLVPALLTSAQRLDVARTYTHVASVQSQVQREVEALGGDLSSVVGGHPLAGRETQGPGGADAELFRGRPWAVCPSAVSSQQAIDDVTALVRACGATPVLTDPASHDDAVALYSHVPQVTASALAALLVDPALTTSTAGSGLLGPDQLSGPGLADTTRLAGSPAPLWTEILTSNSAPVVRAVRALARVLDDLAEGLDRGGDVARSAVAELIAKGNEGRATVPVKRGVRDAGFVSVDVEVDDRPGRLAALLTASGAAGVNVEDVRVEHDPGRPTGLISLVVAPETAPTLTASLAEAGWRVR